MLDTVLWVSYPYIAVLLAVVVGLWRYYRDRFSYSSFSSETLEKRTLFWGSVPWHFAIIPILLAHLLALLFPRAWGALIGEPARLYVLETTGIGLALFALVGIVLLLVRKIRNARVFAANTVMDWLLVVALLVQVALGFSVAFFYRWGSSWYLYTAVPWLASLFRLAPQTQMVTVLPLLIKAHMLGGFFIILIFPFTRLVHFVTFPITYLWRPYQVVWWNRRSGASGSSE